MVNTFHCLSLRNFFQYYNRLYKNKNCQFMFMFFCCCCFLLSLLFFGLALFCFVFFSSVIVIPFFTYVLTFNFKWCCIIPRIMFQSLVKVYICKSKLSEEALLFPHFVQQNINKIKLRYHKKARKIPLLCFLFLQQK